MSMFKQSRQSEPKVPSLIAWYVTKNGEKSYWHRIGASWNHKDSQGMTMVLDSLPVDGRVVLGAPKEAAA